MGSTFDKGALSERVSGRSYAPDLIRLAELPSPIGGPMCIVHKIEPSPVTDLGRGKRDDALHQRFAGNGSGGRTAETNRLD
jgi:hypothetical protein